MTTCKSFGPNIDKNSKILILCSMPGIKSLEQQEYYAHPQNRFWRLMGLICNCKDLNKLSYEERLKTLLENKIALWDVIESCKRESSLDSDIENEIPNNIPKLLNKYKNLQIICCNGNKSYQALKKFFPEILLKYKVYKLPSTSPANAKSRIENLYNIWNAVINCI